MIQIRNLCKFFGNTEILHNINLDILDGEVISIIGTSGSGKSTLLRCINYLEQPQSGTIIIDDIPFDYKEITLHNAWKLRRYSSMVFQNYNLFQHKTILENLTEPLMLIKKMTKTDAIEKAEKLLAMVGLLDQALKYPRKLSGGQQQRVGIARALAVEPKIILFDEPTSSLDPELVKEVLKVIRNLAKQQQTMIIVTHEIQFAKLISDRIIFLNNSVIEEIGTVDEIFGNTSNKHLINFLQALSLDDL